MAGAIFGTPDNAFNVAAGTSLGVAQAVNPTVGHFHLVLVDADTTTATVTDTLGNTYTEVGSATETGVARRLHAFVAPVTVGGSANTITAAYGASVGNRQILAIKISGASAFDVFGASDTSSGGGVNPTPTASATNAAQPAFAIAAGADYQSATLTPGVGYTDGGSYTNGVGFLIRLEYRAVTNIGVQTANFACPGSDRANTAFLIFTDIPLPVITAQPASTAQYAGLTATFNISATGTGTLHYQWKVNGSNVGTDSSSYTTGALTPSNNRDSVTCVVTDNNGSTTSNAAILTVLPTSSSAWIKA